MQKVLRVTFDSNAWQPVVRPEAFPRDPRQKVFRQINKALRSGLIAGYISETVATLEAIPKRGRTQYLSGLLPLIEPTPGRHNGGHQEITLRLGGDDNRHPGLKPVLSDRLEEAFGLGLRLLPSPRFGIPRPKQIDREDIRIPLAPEYQGDGIWKLMERNSDVTASIEARGVGCAVLEKIAADIQKRLGLPEPAWFDGLDQAQDAVEEKQINAAYGEWADGDSVALHIAYDIDLFCTEDRGRSSSAPSILDEKHRQWLTQTYNVQFISLTELAEKIASQSRGSGPSISPS